MTQALSFIGKPALGLPLARICIIALGLLLPFPIWPQSTHQNTTTTQPYAVCPFCGVWAISDESYDSPSVTLVGKHIVITSRQIAVPHCPSISYDWEATPKNKVNTEASFTLTPKFKTRSATCFVVGKKITITLNPGLFSNGNLAYAAFEMFPNNESSKPLTYEGFNALLIDPEQLNGYDDRFSIAAIRDQMEKELRRCNGHVTGNGIANRADIFCAGQYSGQPYNASIGASMMACKHQILKYRLRLLQKGSCSKGASLTIKESDWRR